MQLRLFKIKGAISYSLLVQSDLIDCKAGGGLRPVKFLHELCPQLSACGQLGRANSESVTAHPAKMA